MTAQLAYSPTQDMAGRVSTALLAALSEHGAPNSFAFSELVGSQGAMLAGKAIRLHWQAFCLNFHSRLPAEFRSVRVNFSGGRLHLVDGDYPHDVLDGRRGEYP